MKNFNELSKNELQKLIDESGSLSDVLRKLERKLNHGNFRTLKRHCAIHNINIDCLLKIRLKYRE